MEVLSGFVGEGAVCASYLQQAYRIAQYSQDPSTQVGCVIVHPSMGVISLANNSFPNGITPTHERLHGADKHIYMEHAERNALYRCTQGVLSTKGCHMYTTLLPCFDCARGIIQSGITQVFGHKEMYDLYHPTTVRDGIALLEEAGIRCAIWQGKVFTVHQLSVFVRGNAWKP